MAEPIIGVADTIWALCGRTDGEVVSKRTAWESSVTQYRCNAMGTAQFGTKIAAEKEELDRQPRYH
ncbi:MAG: hypothetical protein M5U34_37880 [Chloroflexi bacterium]|nr:hypothetical protein [Chloroflexota bacterium]